MSCFKLTDQVCNQIESLAAKFWWQTTGTTSHSLHWKAWAHLSTSKGQGGLGFKNIAAFNSALLSKQLWRLISQPNLLMSKVLKAKYYPSGGLLHAIAKGDASWLWKSWLSSKSILQKGLRYQVGDGKSIKIWESPWLVSTPNFLPETPQPPNCHLTWVSELFNVHEPSWNSTLVMQIFNSRDAQSILQIPISQTGQRDKLVWHFTPHGRYSVNSGYKQLLAQQILQADIPESFSRKHKEQSMWKRLWKLNIKGKVKHFLWRAFHKILPTGDRMRSKGIQSDDICKLCGETSETLEHLLFHCSHSQLIWKLAAVEWGGLNHLSLDFSLWWLEACSISPQDISQSRLELTAYVLWAIWKSRNAWYFNSTKTSALQVVQTSHAEWAEYKAVRSRPSPHPPTPSALTAPQLPRRSCLTKVGYYELSISSIYQHSPLSSGVGILIHNDQSVVVQAHALVIDHVADSKLLALDAIRKAQLTAYQCGWQNILITIDVEETVRIVTHRMNPLVHLLAISDGINLLSNLFDNCLFEFVARHTHSPCNRLAQFALDSPISVHWDSHFPSWISVQSRTHQVVWPCK